MMIAALVIIVALTTPEVAVGWSRSMTRVCSQRRMTSSSSLLSHRSSSSPSSSGKEDDTERKTDDEEQSNFESVESDDVDDNDLIPYILRGQINLAELFSSLDTTIPDDDESSTQREQGRRRRVILRDWLNHQEEGGVAVVCVGDSCGDDSEVSSLLFKSSKHYLVPYFHSYRPLLIYLCTNSSTSNVTFLKNSRW